MQTRLILAAAFVLAHITSGCATAPPPATRPSSAATVTAPAGASANERLLRDTGSGGATIQAVERALGAPHVLRRDGAGAALTYRLEGCSLLLLFAADSRNTLRLAEAHPGPERIGEPAPTLAQCASAPRRN